MPEDQFKVLKDLINENNKKFDDYVVSDLQWKEKTEEWQKQVQPDIDSVANAKVWGKVTLGILTVGGLISGIGYSIISIFKK